MLAWGSVTLGLIIVDELPPNKKGLRGGSMTTGLIETARVLIAVVRFESPPLLRQTNIRVLKSAPDMSKILLCPQGSRVFEAKNRVLHWRVWGCGSPVR